MRTTPLREACRVPDNMIVIRLLVDKGASVNMNNYVRIADNYRHDGHAYFTLRTFRMGEHRCMKL
jgi:hypothetical protein